MSNRYDQDRPARDGGREDDRQDDHGRGDSPRGGHGGAGRQSYDGPDYGRGGDADHAGRPRFSDDRGGPRASGQMGRPIGNPGMQPGYGSDTPEDRRPSPPAQRGPHTGRGPKGYQRSDDRIHEDVCELLAEHGEIDASDIEVEVSAAIVTLSGTVDSRPTKRLAEDLAESVRGVHDVHNQLRVSSGQQVSRNDQADGKA